MRMPRFTIRGMMLAIATAATALGLVMHRRQDCLRAADEHRARAQQAEIEVEKILRIHDDDYSSFISLYEYGRTHRHHVQQAGKYRRAARFPWLPIEADPPEPPLARPWPPPQGK